jgi:predicted ArsR family transcriptional regulator
MGINPPIEKKTDPWGYIDRERERVVLPDAPAGSITLMDYAQRYGVSKQIARKELESLVRMGTMEHGKRRGHDASGRLFVMHYYWLAEKKKKQ